MIPLRDSTPSNSFPLVTLTLIIINTWLFYHQVSLGPERMSQLVYTFGLVPAHVQDNLFGFLPFITSTFLHGSWLHVIGNMWILWLFGDNVEDKMGKGRFLLFYLICGFLAGLSHYFADPFSQLPVVGASGAVAGIMGAYFLMFKHASVLTFVPPFFLFNLPAWIYLGIWALSQLSAGLFQSGGQVAFWAHIGGFIAGMILYRFFLKEPRQNYY
ncbi:Peptidase S54, rhomboid domain [Syntrophomonas zehnderi OL-4]|uniref:Peptidase S54, rhomboid domain n=1 Tax=Syntrophomonas zehnderi OL-4 TaxID=690567 RepID=A0A0E4C9T3_9FIRM|nr:rhomboid family intramembrane serine protease [Syntrophomonas zehnderi]CFY11913.1 Peptidase S54, rhomboid domain [Syntrophomonas zehnderi OL-4]